jgi:cytochrome c-type biogenesis protein CcmH/NrfG
VTGGRPVLAIGASGVVLALIVAGASLSRQGLADLYRSRAQRELATHPFAALGDVDRSLEIDASSIQSYYVKAAALARFDQSQAAEAALEKAVGREPGNFVTWVLLGDIAVRKDDLATANIRYRHAHRLNPRDVGIARLATAPRQLLQVLAKS